jgi:hypothetical protein
MKPQFAAVFGDRWFGTPTCLWKGCPDEVDNSGDGDPILVLCAFTFTSGVLTTGD